MTYNFIDKRASMTYSSRDWIRPVTIVESSVFLPNAAPIWSDEEQAEFVNYIAANPESGNVIPETGGLRKIRWGKTGSGKRGGVRIVYYFYTMDHPLFLLAIYTKADQANLTPNEKRALTMLSTKLKAEFQGRKRKRP